MIIIIIILKIWNDIGYYSTSGADQVSVSVCTACVVGMYTDVAKVGQSSDICKICAAGQYSDKTASIACLKCSSGRYCII